MTEVATARIYLGSSFASKAHKDRAAKAQEYLEQNPTVEHIHFPFDFPVVDPIEPDDVKPGDLRSLLWQKETYQNDINGVVHATSGVFLYDMDELDDGCAFEIGFMRAQNKPVLLVPFTEHTEKKKIMNLMLAQGVTAFIDGNTELEKLKTYDFNRCPSRTVVGYGII